MVSQKSAESLRSNKREAVLTTKYGDIEPSLALSPRQYLGYDVRDFARQFPKAVSKTLVTELIRQKPRPWMGPLATHYQS